MSALSPADQARKPAPRPRFAPPQVTTRDFLNTFFYYRKMALLVLAITIAIGTGIAFLVPPTYRAEARLLTLYAGYYTMQLDHAGQQAASSFEASQVVDVEAQILASPQLHRAVIQAQLGPEASPADVARGVRAFENDFHIEKFEQANVIALSYVAANPNRAAAVLEQVIKEYFRQRSGVFTSGRVAFLASQRDKIRSDLNKANAQLIAFQAAHHVVDIDQQIKDAVTLQALLSQRTLENDSSFAQDSATLKVLQREAQQVPATIELFADNGEKARTLNDMQLTLLQLQARRADLLSRYMPGSPFVTQIDEQITDVKKSIQLQEKKLIITQRTGHNNYYDTVHDRISRLMSDVAGEVARKQSLADQSKAILRNIQQLISVANELRRLTIERDLLESSFKTFSQQVEQARIQQNQVDTAASTNVRIIQAPFPPAQRSNPPILFIAASVVAGILLAGVSILIRSSLRETFISPEEVERALHLPVLSAPIGARQPRRRGSPSTPADPLPWQRADCGRMISAINHIAPNPGKVVLLQAAFGNGDELKASTQGLAEELERRSDRPVLILDLAPGRAMFGSPETDGLLRWGDEQGPAALPPSGQPRLAFSADADTDADADADADAEAIFSFTAVERRQVVIGRLRPGAALPSGRQGSTAVGALREIYDSILIPVPLTDANGIGVETAPFADVAILAIRAESTRRPVAQTLKSRIRDAGAPVVGITMTNRSSYIPAYVYRFL